jgi:hypothetical protein
MKQFFKDDAGKYSMNRLVGFILSLILAGTMYHNSFSDLNKAPSEALVYSVAGVIFGCLGLSTTKAIFKKEDITNQ